MTTPWQPTLDAVLNATSACLVGAGWWLARRRRVVWHRRVMLGAFASSSLFLGSYLVYHARVGSVRFAGTGALRVFYLSLLATHTVLAAAIVPLVLVTLTRGLRGHYHAHRPLARITAPLWLWVSLSGVTVYWMLYLL